MSMGPLSGILGSAAGSQRAQNKGTDVEKTQHDSANQSRRTQSQSNAEKAAGVGQTEQDEGTSDRDADGRRLWEDTRSGDPSQSSDADQQEPAERGKPPASRDPSGIRGNQLDLEG